ncbi:gsr3398 [Gloeobacter violaceus PCC 7421]|uniref:Gsr3398 protein n=1 Tax=Gloeobacter violaceus (strain ATCC 29082 / PCC 7421) TaxID=251221 RepID=Q7NFX6_GLOVI|nr:gsr3398 [Gloeobacter violaceus PCC 7421]
MQMTPEQAVAALTACVNLTAMYLPIYLVRIDERTGKVFILAGDDFQVLVDRNGELEYPNEPDEF